MRLLLVMLAMAVVTPVAMAAPPRTDWARGLVIADGIGLADRHAPNPAVARGTSRRAAETDAKKQLAAALGELPVAGGGDVGAKAKADAAVKARLAAAVETAVTLAADPETDGSWRVTLAVPIEAVRQAIAGPRAAPAADDTGTRVVVVDGVGAKPAVGYTVGAIAAPTLWTTDAAWAKHAPAWAKDAPRVTAKAAKAGTIEVPGIDATPATLFVIITKQ